jgi:hypothetical protein
MPPYLKRVQPMPNVLAYVSVFQRMSDIFHTLAYASAIRNSVTGPLHIRFRILFVPVSKLCFTIGHTKKLHWKRSQILK